MALVTRCPDCATAFRVTAQQLQAHDGDVRCGHCGHVFNGFTTLTTVQKPEDGNSVKTAETSTNVQPVQDSAALEPSLAEELAAETSDTVSAMSDHYTYDIVQPCKSQRSWGFASLFLLFLLTGQAVYFYRTEISIIAPGTRPYLEQYCALLLCTVPLPQQAELLSIESSDLRADPAQRPGSVTLTATVRNHAPFPQAYPALELTLTDTQDQPLASRIFTSGEYLKDDAKSAQTIAPAHEIDVKLHLDSSDLNAAGYRLFLLYP